MGIDHRYTDNVVCPWCGYIDINSWEFKSDDDDLGLIECGECGKEFYATRHVSVNYSTKKARYGTCLSCGKEDMVIESWHSGFGKYENLCLRCGLEEKKRLIDKYIKELESV